MVSSMDGEEAQLISNLAYTLLLLLRHTPNLGSLDDLSSRLLSTQLREWLRIHGITPQIKVGVDYMKNSGAVQELLNIEMLKAMQQNVLTHIRENGFPEGDQQLAVSAAVPQSGKDAISLTIKLRTEKVSFG